MVAAKNQKKVDDMLDMHILRLMVIALVCKKQSGILERNRYHVNYQNTNSLIEIFKNKLIFIIYEKISVHDPLSAEYGRLIGLGSKIEENFSEQIPLSNFENKQYNNIIIIVDQKNDLTMEILNRLINWLRDNNKKFSVQKIKDLRHKSLTDTMIINLNPFETFDAELSDFYRKNYPIIISSRIPYFSTYPNSKYIAKQYNANAFIAEIKRLENFKIDNW
jgi:hypothetical protein